MRNPDIFQVLIKMLTQDGTPVELQRNFAAWQWLVPSYLLSKVFQVAEHLLYNSFELMFSYNFLRKLSHYTVSKALLAPRYVTSAHKDPYPARQENWVRLKGASVWQNHAPVQLLSPKLFDCHLISWLYKWLYHTIHVEHYALLFFWKLK